MYCAFSCLLFSFKHLHMSLLIQGILISIITSLISIAVLANSKGFLYLFNQDKEVTMYDVTVYTYNLSFWKSASSKLVQTKYFMRFRSMLAMLHGQNKLKFAITCLEIKMMSHSSNGETRSISAETIEKHCQSSFKNHNSILTSKLRLLKLALDD